MDRNNRLNTPEGLLVRLKTKLCLALNVNAPTLKLLIDRYVSMNYDRTSTRTHFTKVNIYNELSSDKMTIKVFINKFLRIIQIQKLKITVTVTTSRGKEVTVTEEVHLGAPTQTEDNSNDDNDSTGPAGTRTPDQQTLPRDS